MPRKDKPWIARRDVPEANHAVVSTGRQRRTIRREAQRLHSLAGNLQRPDRLAAGNAPQLDRPVGTARCECFAIGREGDTRYALSMARENVAYLSRAPVPQLHEMILSAR